MNSRPRSVRRDERTAPRQLIIGDGSSVSAVSQTSDFFVRGAFWRLPIHGARALSTREPHPRHVSRHGSTDVRCDRAQARLRREDRQDRQDRRRAVPQVRHARTHPPLGCRLLFSVITPPRRRVARPRAPCAGGGDRPTRGASASKSASAFARGAVSRAVHFPRRPAPLPPRDTPTPATC